MNMEYELQDFSQPGTATNDLHKVTIQTPKPTCLLPRRVVNWTKRKVFATTNSAGLFKFIRPQPSNRQTGQRSRREFFCSATAFIVYISFIGFFIALAIVFSHPAEQLSKKKADYRHLNTTEYWRRAVEDYEMEPLRDDPLPNGHVNPFSRFYDAGRFNDATTERYFVGTLDVLNYRYTAEMSNIDNAEYKLKKLEFETWLCQAYPANGPFGDALLSATIMQFRNSIVGNTNCLGVNYLLTFKKNVDKISKESVEVLLKTAATGWMGLTVNGNYENIEVIQDNILVQEMAQRPEVSGTSLTCSTLLPGSSTQAPTDSTTGSPVDTTRPSKPIKTTPSPPSTTTTAPPIEMMCQPRQLSYCSDIGYDLVHYNTSVGVRDLQEAENTVSFFQLVEASKCYHAVKEFACYILQPECDPYRVEAKQLQICRTFCEVVVNDKCASQFIATDMRYKVACSHFPLTKTADNCLQACATDDFKCNKTGFCIPADYKCDKELDCGPDDQSDEMGCPCDGQDVFKCNNTACLAKARQCDNRNDCGDWGDELSCTCDAGQKQCTSTGQCFLDSQWCDYEIDCDDGEDERGCRLPISTNGVAVDVRSSGQWITDAVCDEPPVARCEPSCTPECRPSDIRCQNSGVCMSADKHCDGINDCGDFSDEYDCPCDFDAGFYWCDTYLCKSYKTWCDHRPDCSDGTDEPANCTCRSYQFRCDNGQCIPIYKKCDGQPNCDDNSDEQHCEPCSQYEFACGDGRCIPSGQVCDGVAHCLPNRTDELQNCTCEDTQFRCDNGQCLDIEHFCDKVKDCLDGSDEFSGCQGKCPPDHPVKCVHQPNSTDTMCIPRVWMCDGIRHCHDGEDEYNCRCDPAHQFQCLDGTCKPWDAWCNTTKECADGSDEAADCVCKTEHQLQCVDGMCYAKYSRCDGSPQCKDHSDEVNCTCAMRVQSRYPQFICDSILDCPDFGDEIECEGCTDESFVCNDGSCVTPDKICDGVLDCGTGEDEALCMKLSNKTQGMDVRNWTMEDEGFLYGRMGNKWYKVCARDYEGRNLTELGDNFCRDIWNYDGVISAEIVKDNAFDLYLVLDDPQDPKSHKMRLDPCYNRQVLRLHCGQMSCGARVLKNVPTQRIVGGQEAYIGEWPWYAAIYKDQMQWCGGTVIDEHWVLTAAHCFDDAALQSDSPPRFPTEVWRTTQADSPHLHGDASLNITQADEVENPSTYFNIDELVLNDNTQHLKLVVRVGVVRNSTRGPFDQFIPVIHVVRHSNYNPDKHFNDIAMVKVSHPNGTGIQMSPYVQPICTPYKQEDVTDGVKCNVPGLGALGWRLRQSDFLRYITLPFYDTPKCQKFPTLNADRQIQDMQICGGIPEGGKDSCTGDSGGPAFCPNTTTGRFESIGVVSYGFACAKPDSPGVYTKVSMFTDWIGGVMEAELREDPLPSCGNNTFTCFLGNCLPAEQQCDGTVQCEYFEDEDGCTKLKPEEQATTAPPDKPTTPPSGGGGG